MYFEINKLIDKLGIYKNILIYGAGNYAMKISCILKSNNIWDKVSGFVVSEEQNNEMQEIYGIPIIVLEQLEKVEDDTVILVAVSEQYANEIEQILHEKQLGNKCVFLHKYVKSENLENWNAERSFQELYEYIIQWCLYYQTDGIVDNNTTGEQYDLCFRPEKRDLQKVNKNLLVFIVGMITARTSRIAMALKRRGYQIKVIKWNVGIDYVGEAELRRNKIEIRNCKAVEDMLFWALQEDPQIYYIDSPWEKNTISRLMLIYREYFGKIVMAPYDVLNLTHLRVREIDYILERYALENADGVVWRYFSKEALQTKLGFKFQGESIDFLDYCEQYELSPKSNSDILKICCLPTHTKPFLQHIVKDFGLAREATVWEIMDKIGERNDCEFYVFFWEEPDDEDRAELKKIKRIYSNFYYFVRVDHERLIYWIAEYDYGFVLSIDGDVPEWPKTLEVGLEYYHSEGVYKYASQNKFYDFLNAHLPIVATYPIKLCEVLSEYGVIIDMSLERLDIDFLRKNKKIFYEKAVRAHEELLIDKHISRLIEFFKNIYRGK